MGVDPEIDLLCHAVRENSERKFQGPTFRVYFGSDSKRRWFLVKLALFWKAVGGSCLLP